MLVRHHNLWHWLLQHRRTFDVPHARAAYAGALCEVEACEACQLPHCHQAAAAEALAALQVKHTQRCQPADVRQACSEM